MEPHRDLQGTIMFPFQVMCPLSNPGQALGRMGQLGASVAVTAWLSSDATVLFRCVR